MAQQNPDHPPIYPAAFVVHGNYQAGGIGGDRGDRAEDERIYPFQGFIRLEEDERRFQVEVEQLRRQLNSAQGRISAMTRARLGLRP
ncbi:hypothetical protein A4X09_0g4137 [Tilletia walkeri]|uniref:Uncharacterized protein n=1 Tax=Tilletia walkeri TaxID=117179 RepID=A0A8X7N904_9BASI|nr:hypothetical protein A4X09_0g4137 [Tilletia walkeri]